VRGFVGVLKTRPTNVVADEIAKGRRLRKELKERRRDRKAETDPTADLDGWGAAVKVDALAHRFDERPDPDRSKVRPQRHS